MKIWICDYCKQRQTDACLEIHIRRVRRGVASFQRYKILKVLRLGDICDDCEDKVVQQIMQTLKSLSFTRRDVISHDNM